MSVKLIESHGNRVIYVDYSDRTTEPELLGLLEEVARLAATSPQGTGVLSNFVGVRVGPTFLSRANQIGKEVFVAKGFRNAVLGIDGIKEVLFKGYLRFTGDKNTRAFGTEAEALAWLAQ
jgi:hypothetical protein